VLEMISRRSFLQGAVASTAILAARDAWSFASDHYGGMLARYAGVISGRHRWAFRSSNINTKADLVAAAEYFIDVVLPDAYPVGGPYPILFVGPVL
jgi:hypothetical protein